MSDSRRRIGKTVLIGFSTIHIDRGGQTGEVVAKVAEIAAIDGSDRIVAVTRDGQHHFVPSKKAYIADSSGYRIFGRKRPVIPAFFAVHQLVRDFQSATARTRWLSRKDAHKLLCSQ